MFSSPQCHYQSLGYLSSITATLILVAFKKLYKVFKKTLLRCATPAEEKQKIRLELYHYWLPEHSSEERLLTKLWVFWFFIVFFFSVYKLLGGGQKKSSVEEQDICFYSYALTSWDCAPPDVLCSLSSMQAAQLISSCGCIRISQVFRGSPGMFVHLMCQMAWDMMGCKGDGRYRSEDRSVQRKKGDCKDASCLSWASPPCSWEGLAQLCHIMVKLGPLFQACLQAN